MTSAETYAGNYAAATEFASRALAHAPHDPLTVQVATQERLSRGDLATSIARATEAWRRGQHEDWRHHIAAGAAALAQLGRRDQAQQRLSHILAVAPTATADSLTRNIRWEHQSHIQHLREGLVLAGLPTS